MESKVALFEKIRQDREREGLSIRALARRYGVHRRTVSQALSSAIPPKRTVSAPRPAPSLGPYRTIIDGWLTDDLDAPRKQRHTARRIWERLREEHGATCPERTVRHYVRARRREIQGHVEAYVPQVHAPAGEAQVDFGEAKVDLGGQRTLVYLFLMRASHSGASYVCAFPHQRQQAMLEGHVMAFEYFGGVFGLVRYDNMKTAVKKILKGRRRQETDRLIALRSHYRYESWFTLPGPQGAHEKGGVEGEVGRFRRRHLVPVPEVDSIGDLNQRLIGRALAIDLGRTIDHRPVTVAQALSQERQLLRPLPDECFPYWEDLSARVNQKSTITVRQNRYSVPIRLVGLKVAVKASAREIVVSHQGREVARHERLVGSHEVCARIDHYLDLLRHRPGALAGSQALDQSRKRGDWPDSYDRLWQGISERYGRSEAARQMVDVALLCRDHGAERVELATKGAIACGAFDGRAVALLARRAGRVNAQSMDLPGRLAEIGTGAPDISDYDAFMEV